MQRLLIIDDEIDIATLVAQVAEDCGYAVRTTHQAEPFKAAYSEFQPDVVVLDLGIPKTDGVELLSFLMEVGSSSRILIFSGLDHRMLEIAAHLGTARGLNMAGVLAKPIRVAELRAKLRSLHADLPVNRSV